MKKVISHLITIIMVALISHPSYLICQENEESIENDVRIGFGVGFGHTTIIGGGNDLTAVVLPIDFTNFSITLKTRTFRFEPNFGYFNSTSSSDEHENSFSNLRFGAIIAGSNYKGSLNYYYGAALGVIFTSESSSYSNDYYSDSHDDSKTDFYIGPVFGGEYMFSDNFSLGGEIQLNYIMLGKYDDNNSDVSSSIISTKGMLIVRWYVN